MSLTQNLYDEFLSSANPATEQIDKDAEQIDKDAEQIDKDAEQTEKDGITIRDVAVDEMWIDRSKIFLDFYFQQVEIDAVDKQYRESDFSNFQNFLNCNSLHYFESIYLRANNKIIWINAETVEKARQKTGDSLDQFLLKEGIMASKQGYIRVIHLFSKVKWLEILLGLGITQIIDSEGLLMSDTMDQMLGDKMMSLKFMLACFLSGLAKIVTSDFQLVGFDELRTASFSSFPIGLQFDKDSFTVMIEWKNHILDSLRGIAPSP